MQNLLKHNVGPLGGSVLRWPPRCELWMIRFFRATFILYEAQHMFGNISANEGHEGWACAVCGEAKQLTDAL